MTQQRRSFHTLHIASLLLGGALVLGGIGCESKKTDTKPAETNAEKTQQGTDKAVAAADKEVCATYQKRFCEVVGETSQECGALGAVASVLPIEACKAGLDNLEQTKTKYAASRKVCNEMLQKLCKDTGEQSKSCTMVKEVVPTFPSERCAKMMESYDEVLAELKQEEEKNKPMSPEMQAKIAGADAPSFGPADAKVTLVEFSDFECPYCQMAYEAVEQVKKKYPDKVRVVFRQFPLSFHANAHMAHQAALAAGEQNKFWEFHDLLFKNQTALGREDLEGYAKQLKLNMGKFNKALDTKKYAKQVDADIELGGQVYVEGTPTLFINGVRAENATQFGSIDAEIQKILAASK